MAYVTQNILPKPLHWSNYRVLLYTASQKCTNLHYYMLSHNTTPLAGRTEQHLSLNRTLVRRGLML